MKKRRTIGHGSMTKKLAVTACSMLAVLGASTFASAQAVRTGSEAYGSWQTDAPGVLRKITPRICRRHWRPPPRPTGQRSFRDRPVLSPKPCVVLLSRPTSPG